MWRGELCLIVGIPTLFNYVVRLKVVFVNFAVNFDLRIKHKVRRTAARRSKSASMLTGAIHTKLFVYFICMNKSSVFRVSCVG